MIITNGDDDECVRSKAEKQKTMVDCWWCWRAELSMRMSNAEPIAEDKERAGREAREQQKDVRGGSMREAAKCNLFC